MQSCARRCCACRQWIVWCGCSCWCGSIRGLASAPAVSCCCCVRVRPPVCFNSVFECLSPVWFDCMWRCPCRGLLRVQPCSRVSAEDREREPVSDLTCTDTTTRSRVDCCTVSSPVAAAVPQALTEYWQVCARHWRGSLLGDGPCALTLSRQRAQRPSPGALPEPAARLV